jgi:NAD(P)-dependent dehydrogenase (short-subunit alcohol dehydrogenase family)
LDVRDAKKVEEWITDIVEREGRLDGAANLAGVIGPSTGISLIEDYPYSEFEFILDVNMKGIFNCLRAELKAMKSLIEEGKKEEGKGQKLASIVNMASVAGAIGMARNCAYVASKHAVVGLTKSAAKECGGCGVRVNAIAPYVFLPSSLPFIPSFPQSLNPSIILWTDPKIKVERLELMIPAE